MVIGLDGQIKRLSDGTCFLVMNNSISAAHFSGDRTIRKRMECLSFLAFKMTFEKSVN